MKKLLMSLFLLLISVSIHHGSGFQINEHGAKAMAMAGAFTGLVNDASAVYFNPAGLTQLSGTHISGGVSLIKPSSSFRGPSPSITEYELDDQIFNPINFYITHRIDEDFAVGVGVNNPYGLGTLWDENWVGKYLAIETEIRTFYTYGVVAYKLTDNLSIGAGGIFAYGDVLIARKTSLSPFSGDAFVHLEGDASAFGFTAGLFYQPIKELSIGVNYRSQVKFEFEGTATTEAPSAFSASLPSGSISAPLDAPANIVVGLAVYPIEKLIVTADFQFVGWSSYDKLELTFNDFNGLVQSSTRDFDDSYILRLGGEYELYPEFALRGGIIYDSNPVKDERLDPTLPDSDRLGLNIGFGYDITNNLTLDLAYLFLRFSEREITNSLESYTDGDAPFNGVYSSVAHLLGINFSYKF